MPPKISGAVASFAPDAAALALVLEASGDALVIIDAEWRYAYFNDLAENLHPRPRSGMLGRKVVDVFPEVESTHFWQVYQRAVQEKALLTIEEFFEPLNKWFDIRAIPIGDQLYVHFRDVTARKLAEERMRLLEEAHARAEREALLNQIGAAVRAASEPEAILKAAVATLGQALHADRCYFVRYDQTRNTARVFPEWLNEKAGIEPLTGRTFQMSAYAVDRDEAYRAGHTHVVDDVMAYAPDNAEPFLSLNLRAMLRVPIDVGNQMRSLTVAMAHEARHWTEDEVRLVENVAALVRSTLASAQVQQREHRIAQQLQEALQPSTPAGVTGLALASYYRAALSEAEVGGDFHDVFDLGSGRFALIVADLSGKGLSAATQIAMIRHKLRYALYTADLAQEGVLAAVVQTLNDVLAERALLAGFATLFVGVWDSVAGRLTYVNAGQEPGLVWRAGTKEVEALLPTGPVLGGFAGGTFTQRAIHLAAGDVFALFTDGMTEVGPSRKEMLGVQGVVPLFAQCCAMTGAPAADSEGAILLPDPRSVLSQLIAAVEAFAQDEGMRDDLAVLIGVRREPGWEPNLI